MKYVFLVYSTDVHHSYSSRCLLGIGLDKWEAMHIIKQQVEKDGQELSKDDTYNLHHIDQTQGYKGEGEFVIDKQETNILY